MSTLRLLGPRYLVQLPEPEAFSPGGIFLPPVAQEQVYDGLVLQAGSGRVQEDGTNWPMQAAAGDRIVTQKAGFWEWDREARTGFVSDSALIARVPGPDHCELLPCGDYVLVQPDRLYSQVDGAVVQRTSSGVLMASVALKGGEEWAEREGKLAFEESQRLWHSPAWQEEPEYFRHRRLHAFLDGLHPEVRRVCVRLGKRQGAGPEFERLWVKRELPLRGVVTAVGPGRAVKGGRRLLSARVEPGEVVRWSAAHQAQVLWDGAREVLAIEARFLEAVEWEVAA